MAVLAGDVVVAADVAVRLGNVPITADSTTWSTTELLVTSTTIAVTSGWKYKIWFSGRISADGGPNTDGSNMRIREDNLAGTQLLLAQVWMPTTTGNGFSHFFYTEYTAVSTGAKTFALTAQRSLGTGVAHRIRATANGPAFFIAERIVD